MIWWRRHITVAVVVLCLTLAQRAFGFCLMTTCDTTPLPDTCTGSRDQKGCSNEGKQVAWASPCLSFSVYDGKSTLSGIGSEKLEDVVSQSFALWQNATCPDGGSPRLQVETYPRVRCDRVGFYAEGPNQNLWILRDGAWPVDAEGENTIALTTLTVDRETGQLLDADVELNAHGNDFTLTTAGVKVDLLSVALHEAGHVLGILHSDWSTSTMASGYDSGSLELRTLEADDTRALCTLMPPGEIAADCDAEPAGGFSTQCRLEAGCCALAPGRKKSASLWGLFAVLAALGTHRRLRRRYSRPTPTGVCQ